VPRRALRDDDLLRAVAAIDGCFIVAVDAQGRVELRAAGTMGQRTLRQAVVPVLEPAAERGESPSAVLGAAQARTGPVPDDLPAYAGVWPGPLLLTHASERCRWFPLGKDGDHALVLTRSKRVMLWTRRSARPLGTRAGGREMAILPAGHLLHWAPDRGAGFAAIWMRGRRSQLAIVRIHPESVPQVAFLPLEGQPQGVAVRDGTFILGFEDRIVLATPETGVVREESAPMPLVWRGGRARPKGSRQWRLATLHDGGLALESSVSSEHGDGYRVGALLRETFDGRSSIDWVSQASMVKAPGGVGLDLSGGGLTIELIGKSIRTVEIAARTVSPRWGSARDVAESSLLTSPLAACEDVRFPAARFMARGEWATGWRVWSDRRGLLHFRSPDPALGSLTLALFAEPPFTAWCSLGWELAEANELRLPMGEPHPLSDWLIRFAAAVAEEVTS
ncbi:MAG: hypothetical protein AAGG01_13220, partial [Planctomycetota bacterium]